MIPPSRIEPAEDRLRQIAARFAYPATPDIGRRVAVRVVRRRPPVRAWQLALAVFLLVVAALLAIPQARALISGYFRIGAVRILPFKPTVTVILPVTATPAPSPRSSATALPTLTPELVPAELADLAGRTTLKDAQARAPFPVMLPAYPDDLGSPDYVFYQPEEPMVILAWRDPADPGKLSLTLYAIDSSSIMISKFQPVIIEETTVNGQHALWAQGPYVVELENGDYTLRKLVEGAALIWQVDQVTYRLQGPLPLDEAVKIAKSLRPVEP